MTHRWRAVLERASWPLLPLWLLVALLLGGALVALPTPAQAVTPVASEPLNREKVSRPPDAVTLAFTRDVDPSVAKVVVLDPDGDNVTSGPLIIEGTNVTTRLRTGLDRGTYTVHYRIDGKNGQPEGGAYQFRYGSGSFSDLPDRSWSGEDDEPAVLRGTNPNGSEAPDPPSSSPASTPGIEVTSQAPTSQPPQPTDPPSDVKPPPGPPTEVTDPASSSEPATATATASPAAESGSGGAPWIVGGVILLLAVGGTVFGLWHKNKESGGAAKHD